MAQHPKAVDPPGDYVLVGGQQIRAEAVAAWLKRAGWTEAGGVWTHETCAKPVSTAEAYEIELGRRREKRRSLFASGIYALEMVDARKLNDSVKCRKHPAKGA